jgi:DNA repair protein SbcC/Rad50
VRPLELVMQGFRSHERRTEISFEGRSLIAIVGPTGAGKSSILDGISYALYGKTAREKSATKKLICSRSEEAQVQLTFAVDGRTYEVTRSMRRSGQSPHVLVDVDSGEHLCSGVEGVSTRIEELLGLDFNAFCSSVLLAQNEFARFLGATVSERSKILKGIFRLEQIDALRDAAKAKVDALGGDLREIEGERRGIPDDITGLIAEATELHKTSSERAAMLEEALPKEERLQVLLRDAQTRSEQATKEVTRYESAARALPKDTMFEDLSEQESSIGALLSEARAALEAGKKRRAAAVNALRALELKHGSERTLLELRSKAQALGPLAAEVDAAEQRIKSEEETVEGLRTTVEQAQRVQQRTLEALAQAEARRAEVEVAHRAHSLRPELKVGEACPVCEQAVATLPKGKLAAGITEVKEAEREAKEAEKKASAAASDASLMLTRAEAGLEAQVAQLAVTRERLAATRAEVDEILGDTDDPLVEIDSRLEGLSAAATEVEAARESFETAQTDVSRNEALEARFAAARRKVAAKLIEVCAAVEIDPPGIEDAVAALAGLARRAEEGLEDRLRTARASLEEAKNAEAASAQGLSSLWLELELGEGATIAKAMARAKSDADVAAERIKELEAKAARAAELDELEAGVQTRQGNFKQLYTDFGP